MKGPASLTGRLILWLSLGAVLLWLSGAGIGSIILRHQLEEAFDSGLRETAERLLALAADGLSEGGEAEGEDYAHEVPILDADDGEYIVYQVRRGDGAVLRRSFDAPSKPFSAPLVEGFAVEDDWRIFTIGNRSSRLFIQVAESRSRRAAALHETLLSLLLPIILLIPLSAIGIFLVVRAGLRPLTSFSAEIARRDARHLAPIDIGPLPTELVPTAEAVQSLIARLGAAIAAERALAANSAHELRTPIAGSLAQTQRLIAELKGHPAEARARQVEESLSRLRHLSEKLLQLARADAGIALTDHATDLVPALHLVVEDARRSLARPERLSLDFAAGASLTAPFDVDAFGIALRNLIENALRHGPPDGAIAVAVPAAGVVSVTSGGPAVAPEILAGLVQRFARGNTSASGSGLGLAIVAELVDGAGGALRLLSPVPGRNDGFRAELTLPKDG